MKSTTRGLQSTAHPRGSTVNSGDKLGAIPSHLSETSYFCLCVLFFCACGTMCSVMSGGRSSPESPHVYRGGFKLPKHLKSPLHLPGEGEDGIGHASPLLHKCTSMTGLDSNNDGARRMLFVVSA